MAAPGFSREARERRPMRRSFRQRMATEALRIGRADDSTPIHRTNSLTSQGDDNSQNDIRQPGIEAIEDVLSDLGSLQRQRGAASRKIEALMRNQEPSWTSLLTIRDDRAAIMLQEIPPEVVELTENIESYDRQLEQLREQLSRIQIVREEHDSMQMQKAVGRGKEYNETIFKSVLEGNLDMLEIKIAAIDIEAPGVSNLNDLVDPESELPILHTALMSGQQQIIDFLIEHGGQELTTKPVTSEGCYLTPFHLALVHQNFTAVRNIVASVFDATEKAAMINQVVRDGKKHEIFPLIYLATSSMEEKKREIQKCIEILVDTGEDFEKRDFDGNTILHQIIKESVRAQSSSVKIPLLRKFLEEIFANAADRWWRKKMRVTSSGSKMQAMEHLFRLQNKAKQTPLALAAQTESPLYLDFVQWQNVMYFYNPRQGRNFNKECTYNITDISSADHQGKYSKSSVMHIVAYNTVKQTGQNKSGAKDILDTEPLKTLIKLKWDIYRLVFYVIGLLHLGHMAALTTFVSVSHILRVNNDTTHLPNTTKETYMENLKDHFYLCWFLLLPILYISTEMYDVFRYLSCREVRIKVQGNILYRFLLMIFSIVSVAWFFICGYDMDRANQILAFTLMFGWLSMVFFTRGIILPWSNIQIGIFPSMLQRIIFFDILPFAVMSFIILIAFSAAFHVLVTQSPTYPKEYKYSYTAKLYLMVKYLVGMPNPQDYSDDDVMPKVLLIVFGLISSILLVNMLIASMNRSYELMRNSERNPLLRQRLSILLLIERRSPACLRRYTQKTFLVKENPRTNGQEMFLSLVDSDLEPLSEYWIQAPGQII